MKNQYVKKGCIVTDITNKKGLVIDFDANSFTVIWDNENIAKKYKNTWIEYGNITVRSGHYTLV